MVDSDKENVYCFDARRLMQSVTKVNETLRQEQEAYVTEHLVRGHEGYCYAWLDNAFCPCSFINRTCPYLHEYPHQWGPAKRIAHLKKLRAVTWLWDGVSYEDFFQDCME